MTASIPYLASLLLLLLLGWTEGHISNGGDLRSLRCMTASQTFCRVLGGGPMVADRLKEIYSMQSQRVREALDLGDLHQLTVADLLTIHPVLLLLLPVEVVGRLDGGDLAALLDHYRHNTALVTLLAKAASLSQEKEKFLLGLGEDGVEEGSWGLLGEEVSDWNGVMYSQFGIPLLAHLPLPLLAAYDVPTAERQLFFMRSWLKQWEGSWESKPPAVKRSWAHLMVRSNYPVALTNWTDVQLDSLGPLLVGATPKELERLNMDHFNDPLLIFKYNFSSVQARALFRLILKDEDVKVGDFMKLNSVLAKLTPLDLLKFTANTSHFRNVRRIPLPCSLPTAKQLVRLAGAGLFGAEDAEWQPPRLRVLGNLAWVLPLRDLATPFPLQHLAHISLTSSLFTFSQAYRMTGSGSGGWGTGCAACWAALPGSSLLQAPAQHRLELMASWVPAQPYPRALALTAHLLPLLGNKKVMRSLVRNADLSSILDLVSSKDVSQYAKELITVLIALKSENKDLMKLPKNMVSILARNSYLTELLGKKSELSIKMLFVSGLTCEDVDKVEDADFLYVISEYNSQLRRNNMIFSKDLQDCCARKLIKYLNLKEGLIQQSLKAHIMDLLTEVDIEAVGGYVLSHLSIADIESSTNFKDAIVSSIGKLSLPELMTACPRSKLDELIIIYLQDKDKIALKELVTLGNLTLFLTEDFIQKIDPEDWKLLLESRYIDQRICTDTETRAAWADLTTRALGPPSTWSSYELEILGDMLIVFSSHALAKVEQSSWRDAADVLKTQYLQQFQLGQPTKFYEICESTLNRMEKQMFVESIKTLIKYLLTSAQIQLNQVRGIKFSKMNLGKIEDLRAENTIPSSVQMITLQSMETSRIPEISSAATSNMYSPESETYSTPTSLNLKETTSQLSSEDATAPDDFLADDFFKEDSFGDLDNFSLEGLVDAGTRANEMTTTPIPETTYSMEINDKGTTIFTVPPSTDDTGSTELRTFSSPETPKRNSVDYQSDDEDIDENLTEFMGSSFHQVTAAQELEILSHRLASTDKRKLSLSPENETHEGGKLDLNIDVEERNLRKNGSTNVVITADGSNMAEPSTPSRLPTSSPNADTPAYADALPDLQLTMDITFGWKMKKIPLDESLTIKEKQLNSDSKSAKEKSVNKRNAHNFSLLKKLECDAFRMVGEASGLVVTKEMIDWMDTTEVRDCVGEFGNMDLPLDVKQVIWKRLDKRDFVMRGKLMEAATSEDLEDFNFNMSTPWALETLSLISSYNKNPDVRVAAVEEVMSGEVEGAVVAALGSLLCERKERLEASPEAMRRAAPVLGRSLPCSQPCLARVASLIQHPFAFGPAPTWRSHDLVSLGLIVAGLEVRDWKALLETDEDAARGLTPAAASCLPPDLLQAIPVKIMKNLPYYVKEAMLINEDYLALNNEQKDALALNSSLDFRTISYSNAPKKNLNYIVVLFCFFLFRFVI